MYQWATERRQSRLFAGFSLAFIVIVSVGAPLNLARAITEPPNAVGATTPRSPEVAKLMRDAETALRSGNVNVALIQLKNAVRLAPQDGEARARLGILLMRTGEKVAAERELRQARDDHAPEQVVVPAILQAMIGRNELEDLLMEFSEPPQTTLDKTAPDILLYRAVALQALGRPAEAKAEMDRALKLRRDMPMLIAGAKLAQQQNDLPDARLLIDEADKLAPNNEEALIVNVMLMRQGGETAKALAAVDGFLKLAPQSVIAKLLRIEFLLDLKDDQKAKEEVDALLKQSPKSNFGIYYQAVLMARAKDFKNAWLEAQNLEPDFVQSEPSIAMMVARIAASSGNIESGGSILSALVSRHPEIVEARTQLAALRLAQKSPQTAVDILLPLKSTDNPQVHALLAQAYLQLHQFNDAIASLEIATASGGDANGLLKRQLALSELQAGNTDQAIQDLKDLAARNPESVEVVVPLIAALVRAGRADEARPIADRLAKVPTKSPLPEFFRGQVLLAQGQLPDAEVAFGRSIANDPKFLASYYYRANVLLARGDSDAARKDLEQINIQDPKNVFAYIGLAQIASNNGQEMQAEDILRKAIKAVPDNPIPRLALANQQVAQHKYDDAQLTVTDLLKVSPNNSEGLALQGQIQFSKGKTAQAVDTFRDLAAANPKSAAAQLLLAKVLSATKDRLAAEDAAKKAIELAPSSSANSLLLIEIQIANGKPNDALTTARTYGSHYPGPTAELLLAETFVRLKRSTDAEKTLADSLNTKPDPLVALRLSQIAMDSGDTKRASAVLANWVTKHPKDLTLRSAYGALLLQIGDQTGARGQFEAILKLRPTDAISLNNLGWIIQKDDPARSLQLVSLAAKIAPRSPEIIDTLGWIKYEQQDRGDALPLLQRAHDLDGNNPWISYHLAVVLDANGKRADAKTLLQSTLAKNPKFADAASAKRLLASW